MLHFFIRDIIDSPMGERFQGFSKQALTLLGQLEKNNQREWFAQHKQQFETELHVPMVQLVSLLSEELRLWDADYVPENPRRAIYRIYRDTRFSSDKTPYKTHIAAQFQHRRVERNRGAGLYFEISRTHLGIAGGVYMPEKEQLQAIRNRLSVDWQRWESLCDQPALRRYFGAVQGDSAARVPKGFDPQSPAAEWLRRRQLYFYKELKPEVSLTPRLHAQLLKAFKLLLPAVQYLNDAILREIGEERSLLPQRPEPMF